MSVTLAALRDPSLVSGYKRVQVHPNPGRTKRYRGQSGKKFKDGRHTHSWRGPWRATPEEAAKDYCEYANSNAVTLPSSYPTPTVDMGGSTHHAPTGPAVIIKRQEWKGATDLYDVLLFDDVTGAIFRRKIGITARGQKRYSDIATTFGFSIRPFCKAVTYTTKEKALAAEKIRIAEVEQSNWWRKVGKECFAPNW